MGKPIALDLPPGYLNDFNVDDVDLESIDSDSETPQSILNRIKDKVFSPNKFKTSGTLIGVLLRVDSKYVSACTSQDAAIALTLNSGAATKRYRLNTYKVLVPELHFMLKKPENVPERNDRDRLAIDAFPDMQAIDTLVQAQGAAPGDLVKVELANKGAITRMYFAGPLDPKDTGYIAQDLKDCMDACRKTYTGQGSSGDCVNKNDKAHKLDEVPPLITDAGHTENKLINDNGAPWLANLVDPAKNKNFNGKVWIGKLESNGPKDKLKMINNLEGRNTLIYMPVGVKPTNYLEVIYFFHDIGKFANDPVEWNEIGKIIKKMAEPNAQFENARRNVVFVMPEMMWSQQDSGTPQPRGSEDRTNFKGSEGTASNPLGDVYDSGQMGTVWKWEGKSKIFDRTPLWRKYPLTKDPKISGNIKKLVEDVEKILSEKFGINKKVIQQTTLVGDRYGTVAISNLARMQKLGKTSPFTNLKKIQLWNGSYSSTTTNYHHDNDIKDIALAVNPNKVEIEYHLSNDAPDLPKKAMAAYIGRTSQMTIDWLTSPPSNDKDPLAAALSSLKSFYKEALKYKTSNDVIAQPKKGKLYDKLAGELEDGLKFVEANDSKTLRLSGRWVNLIFRGVPSSVSFDWVSWWEEPNAPTAVSATEVVKTSAKVIKSDTFSNDITKGDEDFFSKFKGKVLLYNSTQTKALKGKTAIVVPQGADLTKPYELIYFLHGVSGTSPHEGLWVGHGFKKEIQNALYNMVHKQGRNIIYVTTQLNIHEGMKWKAATFSAGVSSFASFHDEVVKKIKDSDTSVGLGSTADPQFINLKVYSGGYKSLAGIMDSATTNMFGGAKLQRIDYLDASYKAGIDVVFKRVFVDSSAAFNPGKDLEIHIYTPRNSGKSVENTVKASGVKNLIATGATKCDPAGLAGGKTFNGCNPVQVSGSQQTFNNPGIFLDLNTGGGHEGPLKKRFDTKSLLVEPKPGIQEGSFPIKDKTAAFKPAEVPVSYDDEGNAYNHKGEQLSDKHSLADADVKCKKGKKKKNQRAKTHKPRALKDCEQECKAEARGRKRKKRKGAEKAGKVDCGPNPLGLIDMKQFVKGFKNVAVQQEYMKYYFGSARMAEWIKTVLEDPIWLAAENPNKYGGQYAKVTKGGNPQHGREVQWLIGDISPEYANGIDMVKGHGSHREGIDLDMTLPIWYKHSAQTGTNRLTGPGTDSPKFKQLFEDRDYAAKNNGLVVDYDKTIVLGLLTLNMGKAFENTMILFGESKRTGRRGKPGSNFKKHLHRRILEIQKQQYTSWMGAPDKAFKDIFSALASEGPGGPIGKKLKNMFKLSKNHENHYHVRIGRHRAAHMLGRKGDPFRWAKARLKKKGCSYTGPHKKSPYHWKKWVKQGGGDTVYLKTAKPPKGWKPQPGSN